MVAMKGVQSSRLSPQPNAGIEVFSAEQRALPPDEAASRIAQATRALIATL